MPIKLDKKCLNRVVTFEYIKKDKSGSINSKRLIGKIVSQGNKTNKNKKTKTKKNKAVYIYEALGNNKFSKRKKKVPSKYKKKTYSKKFIKQHKEWLAKFYCTEK